MKFFTFIVRQPHRLWRFLGMFQSPALRMVHALVAIFIVLQIPSGFLTYVHGTSASVISWYHMWAGATLCLLCIAQIVLSFKTHGLRHFYPYLWGDVDQIEKDLKLSLKFKRL